MELELGDLMCCGIKEMSGISTCKSASSVLQAFLEEQECGGIKGRFRYAIFSQACTGRYGERFAAFIREHNLGKLIETDTNINPNSGNRLKVWVWTVDHEAVKNWSENVSKKRVKATKKAANSCPTESQGPQNPATARIQCIDSLTNRYF